jgi:hypothetical protein
LKDLWTIIFFALFRSVAGKVKICFWQIGLQALVSKELIHIHSRTYHVTQDWVSGFLHIPEQPDSGHRSSWEKDNSRSLCTIIDIAIVEPGAT